MDKQVLILIAFHYDDSRLKYLDHILKCFKSYKCPVNIIIDTNTDDINHLEDEITNVVVHKDISHPFHLTMKHREHIVRCLHQFDYFFYIESDIQVPYANFLSYTEKFPKLWPDYVPSFIRIEEKDGEQYISDVTEKQHANIIWVDGCPFIALPFPQHYHAFWIAPQWVLKQTINDDFTKLHDSREGAASYLMWELHKKGLLEVVNENGKFQIKEDCYSWHLPNNYIDSDMPNGKIKVKELFV